MVNKYLKSLYITQLEKKQSCKNNCINNVQQSGLNNLLMKKKKYFNWVPSGFKSKHIKFFFGIY